MLTTTARPKSQAGRQLFLKQVFSAQVMEGRSVGQEAANGPREAGQVTRKRVWRS